MFAWLRRYFGGQAAAPKPLLSQIPATPCDHDLRPVLDERYLAMRDAMAARDRAAILALVTDDFVSEDIQGRRGTGGAMADAVIALDIDRSQRTAVTTLTSIVTDGGEARVQQRYHMTTTERKPNLPQALWTESQDRWRRVGGTWLLASTITEKLEVLRDGRRVFRARIDPADSSVTIALQGPAE